MTDLKSDELFGHFLPAITTTASIILEPSSQVFLVHFQNFTHPEQTSRVCGVRVKPIQGVLLPRLPILVGRFLGRHDVTESLEQNPQGQIAHGRIWLFLLRV